MSINEHSREPGNWTIVAFVENKEVNSMKIWRKVYIPTDLGYELFLVCPYCSALIEHKEKHKHRD